MWCLGLRGQCCRRRLPRRVIQSLMASASELLPLSSSFLFHLLLIYTFDICNCQNLSEDQTSLCGQQRKPEDRPQMMREFRRLRGVLLHTLVTVQTAFLPFSHGRNAIVLTALWILHPQWPPFTLGAVPLCRIYARATCTLTDVGAAHQQVWSKGLMLLCCHTTPFPVFPLTVFCGVFIAC